MCRGAAAVAQTNPMVSFNQPQQVNPLASGIQAQVQMVILNAWESISQGSTTAASQASDAYFAHSSEWQDSFSQSAWDG
jgi:hypothetical protein